MTMVNRMADKEKLSALMDGEMIDNELILGLAQDQDARDTWKNYHLIGDVLRGEAPIHKEWNIAESVALALENEPAHNPLHHSTNVIDLQQARLEAQPKPQQAKRQLPAWLSQFGQVGIAACVSLAVIFGVQEQRRRVNALLQDYELQLRLNSENSASHQHPVESVVE